MDKTTNATTTENATSTTTEGKAAPKMVTVQGWGYRFGNDNFFSFDRVIGGWPIEVTYDASRIQLVPRTVHDIMLDGSRVKMSKLVELGLASCGDQKAAEEAHKASKKANGDEARVKRALEAAEKAKAKAEKLAAEAKARAEALAGKAKLIEETAKTATPPKAQGHHGKHEARKPAA